MDLMEALRTRRAIREFTTEPVGDDVIEELIAAAILAPSARQPAALGPSLWCAEASGCMRWGLEAKAYAAAHLPPASPLHAHAVDPTFEMFTVPSRSSSSVRSTPRRNRRKIAAWQGRR